MPELYLHGGDTLQSVDHPNWQGQVFALQQEFTLQFIDLQMRGAMIIPDPVIQLFHANIDGSPYGDPLSRNRYTIETKSGTFTTGRVRFSMVPYFLQFPTRYVLIVSNFPPLGGNPASWQYDKADATYPRGYRVSSNNGGATWTPHPNDDFMFALFGDPPLPKPEPPPPIDNFATIHLEYFHNPSAITITLITSVPCHLTCYYTEKKPLTHHTSRIERGIPLPWGAYFCFVAWQQVEQTELGDTLTHTFEVPSWEQCQTKWFTFRGKVDTTQSPSVGPIFKHHHTGMLLFQNGSFTQWPDPTKPPTYWKPRHSGPGGTLVVREETNIHDPPYSAKLIATENGTTARLRQLSNVIPYRGQSITISAWTRTIGYGQPRLTILIGPAPYQGDTWGSGPGAWRNITRTFPVQNHHWYLITEVGTRAFDPSPSTAIWDEITVTPP